MAEVIGEKARGRLRLGWMSKICVKVALGSRGWRLHDNACKIGRCGELWCICT